MRIHQKNGRAQVKTMREVSTKGDLIDFLSFDGWSLVRGDVRDAGEWNERREWFAEKDNFRLSLGHVFKGDRPDWCDMYKVFEARK